MFSSDQWSAQPLKVIVPGSQTTATLQNLRPAQNYYIRILAENRLGLSEPSKEIQVSTLEEGNMNHLVQNLVNNLFLPQFQVVHQ